MDDKERKGIIPLSRLANSVASSLFEGNDRDMVWDREISSDGKTADANLDKGKTWPNELRFISFGEG
ncbi:MAG: hypothetical protein K6A71_06655 [Lachnospiraceae bacterium]|nr:hypothetical protein [Lachnospiraceae bacterium]